MDTVEINKVFVHPNSYISIIVLLNYIMIDTIQNIDTLILYFNHYTIPVIKNKKERGEVFTPSIVIQDLLDDLDETYKKKYNKSIFSNKHLKWFDPCVGKGNFMVFIFQRLMSGLEDKIPDLELRRIHILKNMLFMSEISQNNIDFCKTIFCANEYHTNIISCDSLLSDGFNQKFDVVIGNPPFNIDGTKHKGKKNVYVYFSIRAFEKWLIQDGFLAFIHPPSYRINHHKIQCTKTNLNSIYTSKQIDCIKMYTAERIIKLMNVMMNIDYIIIQNKPRDDTNKTKIIDTKNEVIYKNIIQDEFIPNYGIILLNKLKNKFSQDKIEIIGNSQLHAQHIKGTTYKTIHGITKKGLKILTSDKKHKYHDTPKYIINGIGSYNYVFYDKNGEYGVTQSPLLILNPSPNTMKFIDSPLFHYISNATKIIGNNFNKKTSYFLPVIQEEITDLYDYFSLNPKEVLEVKICNIPDYK